MARPRVGASLRAIDSRFRPCLNQLRRAGPGPRVSLPGVMVAPVLYGVFRRLNIWADRDRESNTSRFVAAWLDPNTGSRPVQQHGGEKLTAFAHDRVAAMFRRLNKTQGYGTYHQHRVTHRRLDDLNSRLMAIPAPARAVPSPGLWAPVASSPLHCAYTCHGFIPKRIDGLECPDA